MNSTRYSQELNESPQAFAARIDSLIQALGPIGLQSVQVQVGEGQDGRPLLNLSIIYQPSGPAIFRCEGFVGQTVTPPGSAQDQMTAWLNAYPDYRTHFIRDISWPRPGRETQDVCLLFYTVEGVLPNCGATKSSVVLVLAPGPIAPGATGGANIITGAGIGPAIVVRNRSTAIWGGGVYGWAYPQPGNCEYQGIPSCCPSLPH
jgi:hypothetical protein